MTRAALACALLALAAALAGCSEDAPPPLPPPEPGDLLATGTKLYSQGDEELIIRDFFQDRRGGFFLDIGCYDWRELSTTLYLEDHLGWTGIAVDANDAHRAGYLAHRPGTRFEHYVVTDHSGDEVTFYLNVGGSGISSVSREWVTDFIATFFPGAQPNIREVKVASITLDDLLAKHGVEEIDLLSIDIEGHEPAALRGFDIRRYRPELVAIEVQRPPEPVLAWFDEHGYERIERYLAHDTVNWYFQPKPAAAE